MRKIKVLIVEDEVVIAKDMAYHLDQLGCEVVGVLTTGEEVMPLLRQEPVDIIMMDISLKGKLDGVQTVRLIKAEYETPVIFLTANTDDRSFELAKATKPFAFVEKPFKPKRLIRTVELLIEQIADAPERTSEADNRNFILSDRIFVREKGRMTKIFLSDILYVEADGAYSKIVSSGKVFILAVNLRNLEDKIASDLLMRVHRSYIVNLKHIESIEDNCVAINGKVIPISRSYWSVRPFPGRVVQLRILPSACIRRQCYPA